MSLPLLAIQPTRYQVAVPWLLVGLRVLLAPVAIALAYVRAPIWVWLLQFSCAVLSDWLDGKLARRWNTTSAALRQADSIADTIYALAAAVSLWFLRPAVILTYGWGIAAIVALEALRYPLDWWLFGRGASYHALSAKLFGLSLAGAFVVVLGFGYDGPLLWGCIALGLISEVEGILMSLVLPDWTHDVKHLGRAFDIRRERKQRASSAG